MLVGDRIGLRVLGNHRRQHWVLMEQELETRPADRIGRRTLATELGTSVRPLTLAQLEVVDLLFGEVLAWPPRLDAGVAQLKQVARRAGVSVSAVQARLTEVRSKAEALGLTRQVPLADPEYVYVIARAGFLPGRPGLVPYFFATLISHPTLTRPCCIVVRAALPGGRPMETSKGRPSTWRTHDGRPDDAVSGERAIRTRTPSSLLPASTDFSSRVAPIHHMRVFSRRGQL